MTHTFIPEYEITQRVVSVRIPNPSLQLAGVSSGLRPVTVVPHTLRFLSTEGGWRIEGTGFKVKEDGTLTATWYTAISHTAEGNRMDYPVAPEWVLAVLDGIR